MTTSEIFGDGLIGSVQVQRFTDIFDVVRVHVMAGNTHPTGLMNEDGVELTGATCTVRPAEVEQGIDRAVYRVRQLAHIAKTGRRNAYGLFFYDEFPSHLQGRADMGDKLWEETWNTANGHRAVNVERTDK